MTDNISKILSGFFFKDVNGIWTGSIGRNKFLVRQDKLTDQELVLKTSCAVRGSKGDLFGFLDEQKQKGKIKNFNMDENLLSLTYACGDNDSEFEFFLKNLSDILTKLESQDVCFSCNKIRETNTYKIKDVPTLLCSECVENFKTKMEKVNNEPNNYLTGALCCIIGALAGSVAWILIGYFGFYASIAGYFIAYSAFYGYNFGKGKATKTGVIINIFAIVFALLFAEYIGLFLAVKKEVSLDFLSFVKLSPVFFFDSAFIKSILPSLGLGFLFAGLGSYRIIKDMFKKANELSDISIERI
ncbi:hypothetical protein [Treponema putidum]|uniref:Uncharacterized protein n=1 Tax=Treponema putidum TaxID=221027 RepID=A0AAE9MXF5_9SPIR|nr:hypothetical protein [Treponema putidum]UTY29743.1 hypothetical protein E4N76_12805 [Treponema putidum]UTY32207.1 hypothetical protein E4N75_12620 [Treponema putidum]UTY34602.1 hypothetical protein E4N74_11775 [Treponema putidum]